MLIKMEILRLTDVTLSGKNFNVICWLDCVWHSLVEMENLWMNFFVLLVIWIMGKFLEVFWVVFSRKCGWIKSFSYFNKYFNRKKWLEILGLQVRSNVSTTIKFSEIHMKSSKSLKIHIIHQKSSLNFHNFIKDFP